MILGQAGFFEFWSTTLEPALDEFSKHGGKKSHSGTGKRDDGRTSAQRKAAGRTGGKKAGAKKS